jgi:hypothetical protein
MTNYAPEVEYFITPHCDHCDNTYIEGYGLVPIDIMGEDRQWWCLSCCDQNGVEYNEGTL